MCWLIGRIPEEKDKMGGKAQTVVANTFINNEIASPNYRQMAEIERSLGANLFPLPRQHDGFNTLDTHQPCL